ncbi:MAG: rhomboid family intramembrane serine protease [Bacteroidales bacterium]|nr:rhomboid family intramembrane serine protease [Bacteroidales bacterium]
MSDQRKFIHSLLVGFLLCALVVSMYIISSASDFPFVQLGIHPRHIDGLLGILTSPLVHANINHLIDNTIPLFLLTLATFYFYHDVAFPVLLTGWFLTGFWVWIGARPDAWHVGASGIIYCLASFLFFSGMIRKHPPLLAISLLVTFLYGGMVWGILPVQTDISWESHLYGAMAGLLLAFIYRGQNPHQEEEGEEEEEEEEFEGEDGEAGEEKAEEDDME